MFMRSQVNDYSNEVEQASGKLVDRRLVQLQGVGSIVFEGM